jgi:hypothetical protein
VPCFGKQTRGILVVAQEILIEPTEAEGEVYPGMADDYQSTPSCASTIPLEGATSS